MCRRVLTLLLAFGVVLGDAAPLAALTVRATTRPADSSYECAVAPEDGGWPAPDQTAWRVLGELTDECDPDELGIDPPDIATSRSLHLETRPGGHRPARVVPALPVLTRLRI